MLNAITVIETLNAPIQVVWDALTNKEQMKIWYFNIPDFKLEVGAVFNFFETGGTSKYHHKCQIVEITPLKTLKHTWTYPAFSKGNSVVTWQLEAGNNATKVTLTHAGILNFADGGKDLIPENFVAGWNEIVKNLLKQYVEQLQL